MAANNKANVSTTRGVKGGYFYSAPVGTTDVPNATNFATWTPGNDWENQGYIVEDGFTESVEGDGGEELRDINLDVVDSTEGSYTETVNVGFMEMSTAPLSTIYGHANVTEDNGVITVDHNWGNAGESRAYVFLLLLKNGRKWVKYIPEGKVTERDDFTGNATTVAQRGVTITYLTDASGSGCKDFIAATA